MKNDARFIQISDLLASYSRGEFGVEVQLSNNLDDIDSIISGINMLGENLQETTISRDFFLSVYNAVTDMLFVVDENGEIKDCNKTANDIFGEENLVYENFSSICLLSSNKKSFDEIKSNITANNLLYTFEATSKSLTGEKIFLSCSSTKISNEKDEIYLIIAEDITLKKESETRIMRVVLESLENERKRVADDLHDSIGQELSSIKMMLGVAKKQIKDPDKVDIMNATLDILEGSIQDLRNICFNLMPSVLDKGGLIFALQQLREKINFEINFFSNVDEINLEKQAQVAIYRVIQEFISNSLKHSNAGCIDIYINQSDKKIELEISDDGKGFVMTANYEHDGRGLNTMRSRVETFGGKYVLSSKPNEGVTIKITFIL